MSTTAPPSVNDEETAAGMPAIAPNGAVLLASGVLQVARWRRDRPVATPSEPFTATL